MMYRMVTLDLSNRVAVITGGSRGIGAATVRMFLAAGARVVFNYQRAADAAERLIAELGGDNCAAVQVDLDSPASAQKLIQAAVARFGRVDALVANHGIWPPSDIPIDSMTDEHWRRSLSINLDSVFGLVK